MAYAKSANFTNTEDSGNSLWIEQNHEDWDERENGVYIHGGSEFGTYSVEDIPRMIETLQAIYDSFEAVKPEEPVLLTEALAEYTAGTVIKFDADFASEYVKIGEAWHNTLYNVTETFIGWKIANWPFTVKYNPKEAN